MAKIRRPTPLEVVREMIGRMGPAGEAFAETIDEKWLHRANPLSNKSRGVRTVIDIVTSAIRKGDLPMYDAYGGLISLADCQRGDIDVFDGTLTIPSDFTSLVQRLDISCHHNLAMKLIERVLAQMQTALVEFCEAEPPPAEISVAPPEPRASCEENLAAAPASASDPPSTQGKQHKYRYACDAALVEEAQKLMATEGLNKSQAARRVAVNAKSGPGEPKRTEKQHMDRLRKLLR